MPKAIAHPTDSRLLERCRERLVKAAARHGLKLRQNYNREAPRLAGQIGRYAHAKQYKRMRKALRTLRSRVGRVMRDVQRQVDRASDSGRVAYSSRMQPRWLNSSVPRKFRRSRSCRRTLTVSLR
ncbi:Mobile element protein [Caballeronia sordidicola]|uniref:Mobile element protein n=1 Tax=Caballeronia sordidicola TaxID=196367 RepID=A0A242MUU8_CABSO|nr:Mobile element protein [Caballeronia sordidicola]